ARLRLTNPKRERGRTLGWRDSSKSPVKRSPSLTHRDLPIKQHVLSQPLRDRQLRARHCWSWFNGASFIFGSWRIHHARQGSPPQLPLLIQPGSHPLASQVQWTTFPEAVRREVIQVLVTWLCQSLLPAHQEEHHD